MKPRNMFELLALGMLWGGSYLFIKVAVPEFGAVALMAVRVTLAAAVLAPLVLARGQFGEMARNWRPIALMGVLHYALPFSLIAWSMLTLSAGYTSIINASSPLFAGLVAWAWIGERLGAGRTAGLVIGLCGVALLAWDKMAVGTGPAPMATAAALGASFCYGLSAVLARKMLSGVSPVAVAAGSMTAAALVLLPLSYGFWPAAAPAVEAWGMAAALGVLGTAIAFVLYFRLIADVGPSKAITVTFLIPLFAVVFAALLLGERITGPMVFGGAFIVLGTALSTGLLGAPAGRGRVRARLARALGLAAALGLLAFRSEDARAGEWEIHAPVYLSANAFVYRDGSRRDAFSTLAASAELEIAPRGGPWAASLFGEYHASADERVDGTVFGGLLVTRRLGQADFSAWWFGSRFPGAAGHPTGQARFRHMLPGGNRVGVEYLARRDDWAQGELKLGYYAYFSRSLSLKVLAGARVGSGHQPLARVELAWRLR